MAVHDETMTFEENNETVILSFDITFYVKFEGALPPDLSLYAACKHDGPEYMFSLLNGYCDAPAGVELMNNRSKNVKIGRIDAIFCFLRSIFVKKQVAVRSVL